MKKYNLSKIMYKAWAIFRKGKITFGEALHRAWQAAKAAPINAARIEAAKQAAGIDEECNTWAGWKAMGREVIHGSKALFQVLLIHASKGDNATYKASFFSAAQVQPIPAYRYGEQSPIVEQYQKIYNYAVPFLVQLSIYKQFRLWYYTDSQGDKKQRGSQADVLGPKENGSGSENFRLRPKGTVKNQPSQDYQR